MHFAASQEDSGNDNFIVQLKKRITFVKQNREWRREFMQRSLYEMDVEYDLKQEKIHGIQSLIQSLREIGIADNVIVQKLVEHYHLSTKEAQKYLAKY